jgi:hypothetical protein
MKTIGCALAALVFAASGALAQGKACGPADAAAAEKALDAVVNWSLMSRAWKQFQHCDKGPTEEMFTDAFMRLAVEWKHVDELAAQYQGDPLFNDFVKKQMGNRAAREDVASIYSRARLSCPAKLEAFCAELLEAGKWAL